MRKYFFNYKVTFYFEGGGSMTVKCDEFTYTRLSGSNTRKIELTRPDRSWSVDVDKIVGITAKKLLFKI